MDEDGGVHDETWLPEVALKVSALKRAIAHFAAHFHVGQKIHRYGLLARAFAGWAASIAGVEGKARRAPAAQARGFGVGEDFANGVPKADVGGRAGARRFADRGHRIQSESTVAIFAYSPSRSEMRRSAET
jgi:hypothetical protein